MKLPPALQSQAEEIATQNPDDIVAVYSTDTETCLWASPSHLPLMGVPADSMLGRHWKESVAPEDHDHATLAGSDAMLHGRSIEFGFRAATHDGTRIALRGQAWIALDPDTRHGFLFFQAHPRQL